jgi:hypothetical protein
VVGLVWSYDPKSYAGSINATGKATHARQVKGDDPDIKGLGLGHEANKLSSIKKNSLLRSLMDARWIILVIWEKKVKRWQMKAVDREEMAAVIKEAKVLGQLYGQGGEEGRSEEGREGMSD